MTAGGLAEFLALRDRGASARLGDGGREMCAALTGSLDAAVSALAQPLSGEPLAVVAVGGYGRGEQCLHSDVDIMILHAGADLEAATAAVFYPLWDANLKVGHSVRTVSEAIAAARANIATLTSLLTMRCVAGDPGLVAALEEELAGLLRGRPLAPALAAAEAERRAADPYPVMAADIKQGRGGLRTYHGLLWERRRHELLGDPERSRAGAEEGAAHGDLLRVRNALHAAAGRAVDRFHLDLRAPAAAWLGVAVEELATMMCRALWLGDRLAERRWPDLFAGQADPLVAVGRPVFSRITSRFRRSGPAPGRTNSALGLAVQAVARPEGVRLDSVERDRLAEAAAAGTWTDDDRKALVQLLAAGGRGRAAWGLLEEAGWVDNHFPEWAVVRARPQLAPFHDHPVDAHLWRTVAEMNRLGTAGPDDVRTVFEEVGSSEELMLAAFFHDIGKGAGGDHAVAGAAVAAAALRRWEFGPATVATVTRAVRHHLLLSETATRRDIDDPATVAAVVDAVGDLHTLQVLYLLSIADAKATGTTMWTAWKAALLGSLYRRAAALLEEAPPAAPGAVAAVVAAGGGDAEAVEEHLAAMPAGYREGADPGDVAWHLATVAALDEGPVALSVRPGEHIDRAVVAAADRTGLLGTIATVMAVNGVSILGARAHGRADGVALDVLDVVDDRSGGSVPPERWRRIEDDLRAALAGGEGLGERLRARQEAYRSQIRVGVPVRVEVGDVAGRYTPVEVRCGDRIGRLAEIVAALYGEGLDVAVALVDTRAGEAVDTFMVTRAGTPLRDPGERERLAAALISRLGGEP